MTREVSAGQTIAVTHQDVNQRAAGRQGTLLVTLMAAVALVDQAVKWWAWRHFPWAQINPGGDAITGSRIGTWFADPLSGALLDLLNVGVLGIVIYVFMRCRLDPAVRVTGALVLGGWSSNLLDRLGVHYWTAPDSVRGVVDFIHFDGAYYNVADFFIIFGTPLLVLAILYQVARTLMGHGAPKTALPAPSPIGIWGTVLVGVTMILAVTLGATHYGSVSAASCITTQPGMYAGVSFLQC
jgi:lipoprotein signal peptidase